MEAFFFSAMIKLLKIMMLETPRLFSLAHFKANILVRERDRGREREEREREREGGGGTEERERERGGGWEGGREGERDEMFVCVHVYNTSPDQIKLQSKKS